MSIPNAPALLPWLCLSVALWGAPTTATERGDDHPEYRDWIQAMKRAPRGPFERVRWFCADGSVLPPEPYACVEHGGGIQHGEWSERTGELRAHGYAIANVLSALDPEALLAGPNPAEQVQAILLERFLIQADDGWILRRARYYRGALQVENEADGARRLLRALANRRDWRTLRFPILREAARLLPRTGLRPSLTRARQRATELAEQDGGFASLRTKIHVQPDREDATRVRDYAAHRAPPGLSEAYEALATELEAVYAPRDLPRLLGSLARRVGPNALRAELRSAAARWTARASAEARLKTAGVLLARLREALPGLTAEATVRALDASLALEGAAFVATTELRGRLPGATRRAHLDWLRANVDALYGSGLLSGREREAVTESLARLDPAEVPLAVYRQELAYLGRASDWAADLLRLHFSRSIAHLARIEPLARQYAPDRLRASPLLFHAALVDHLLADAQGLSGAHHRLFGKEIGGGVRSLNPGLARGVLHIHPPAADDARAAGGIYLLPATRPNLPRVAGILTRGAGNALSHVQLLARNLGIPNVVVGAPLVPRIEARDGRRVVLAASPGGIVELSEDGPEWDARLATRDPSRPVVLRPDLNKLDLDDRALIPLGALRASDAGRRVGPKAAHLGELKHFYPEAVAGGLAIPFGVFRALLERPWLPGGPSVFEWMRGRYRVLRALPAGSTERREATRAFLARLRHWIISAELDPDLRRRLTRALRERFGEPGSYGLFVRSDTNVEDLPGFTGAGLNLTLPNVVGLDALFQAIHRVWASPFTERAYAWRQAYMEAPEHVYPAVLLLRSVPVEVSGVMVTVDLDSGQPGTLSVAVNEGPGGAVEGQGAEELRIDLASGRTRLLAQASEPTRRVLLPEGGVAEVPASTADRLLSEAEIGRLRTLARDVAARFPGVHRDTGDPLAADIELGFLDGSLALFQIRPFVRSARARRNRYLHHLDEALRLTAGRRVDLSGTIR